MVSNNRRTKLLPKIIAGQISVALLITTIALGIIFYAQGYRIHLNNFKVFQTGVLVLAYEPTDSIVKINDKVFESNSNTAKNLEPGFYNIEVTKTNYLPWQLSLRVEAESVNIFKNIILFKDNIAANNLTDQKKIDFLNTPSNVLADNSSKKLTNNSYEIRVDDDLVTRLSTQIQKVIWYPDLYHIVYQQGDEIRIIESNGSNDTLLATLSGNASTIFAIGNRGTELYFIDNGQYKMAVIR
jgi:hypothetical protein